MAAAYRFPHPWLFDAPREPVWGVVYDAAHWPEWWRGVRRTEIVEPGDERGEEPPSLLVGRARGELTGTGTWRFYESELGTASTWEWQVATTREWMNAAGPLARPIFAMEPPPDHAVGRRGRGAANRLSDARVELSQSTQNGLPSGSRSTVHVRAPSLFVSTRVAPAAARRSTSVARSSAVRSRCTG